MKAIVVGFLIVLSTACATPPGQSASGAPTAVSSAAKIYAQHCASCHGPERLGGTGPALFAENLERLKRDLAQDVIWNGRASTQMVGFRDKISEDDAKALVDFIYTPVTPTPTWSREDMLASRILNPPLPAKRVFSADPWNLFLVVELADHAITVLDGDHFKAIHRLATRYSLHGGIKYSSNGRFAYWASRDGWITKFDVWNLKVAAEIRVGINLRNIALSPDGRVLVAGNYLPRTLVFLDAETFEPLKVVDAKSRDGQSSRVSAVYTAPQRNSFLVALKDVPELWEVLLDPNAKAPHTGLVHDYRAESGEDISTKTERFPVRVIDLEGMILDDFFMDRDYENILGTSRSAKSGQIVNLVVGRRIKTLPLAGMPHLASGISFDWQGKRLMAAPNLTDGTVTLLDTKEWTIVKELKTSGPGMFMRSHAKSQYAFVDAFFGKSKDTIHVLDKRKLAFVQTLKMAPGKTVAHTEFDRTGRYALISIWENDGAVLVVDTHTLKVIKRIPMRKPSGKYNIWNKTHYDEGTSH